VPAQARAELRDLGQELALLRATASEPRPGPEALEGLLERVMAEMGKSVASLEERCVRLEAEVAQLAALEVGIKADRERSGQLLRAVELLAQQRREDTQGARAQLREVEARFRELSEREHKEDSWRAEADAIRGELDDLRSTKIPSVFQQSTRATRLIAEGLQALRREVSRLQERLEVRVPAVPDSAASLEATGALAALHAELADLRQQVSHAVRVDFEERLAALRADVAAEVATSVRDARDQWTGASRRIASLEPWPIEQASLRAEVRALRTELQEDHARLQAVARGTQDLERRFVYGLPGPEADAPTPASVPALPVGVKAGQWASSGRPRLPSTSPPRSRRVRDQTPDSAVLPPEPGSASSQGPVVLGRRVVWPLSASMLEEAKRLGAGGMLATAGVLCQLKFFPGGSPLRQREGFCSLYLLPLVPASLRFRLFAGSHLSPALEASTLCGKRDQGRHDLCRLQDQLDAEGGPRPSSKASGAAGPEAASPSVQSC